MVRKIAGLPARVYLAQERAPRPGPIRTAWCGRAAAPAAPLEVGEGASPRGIPDIMRIHPDWAKTAR